MTKQILHLQTFGVSSTLKISISVKLLYWKSEQDKLAQGYQPEEAHCGKITNRKGTFKYHVTVFW